MQDWLAQASAFDACSGEAVPVSDDLPQSLRLRVCPTSILVTFLSVDDCGNSSSCVQELIIVDEQAPETNCPPDRSFECGDPIDDKQAWLDNFHDDAIVQDPIGKSMIDPTGEGFRGKAAIEAFWDKNIAHARPMFSLQSSICAGDECANIGTLTIQFPNGLITQLYGVFVYAVDPDGCCEFVHVIWIA